MEIETKKELSKYLIMNLIVKQRDMWDIDLAELCHLTDPECNTISKGEHSNLLLPCIQP